MPSLLSFSWLIPVVPLLGAILIWVLLVSFKRTMNRLTKPISYFLIACVGLSTCLSFALFSKHISGQALEFDLDLFSFKSHLNLYVDKIENLTATIFGFVSLIVMTLSYYLMDRKQGYVLYFILLSLFSGSIFTFILTPNLFQRVF